MYFQCYICQQAHRHEGSHSHSTKTANKNHYGCPRPKRFSDAPPGNLTVVDDFMVSSDWWFTKAQAQVLQMFLENNQTDYTQSELEHEALDLINSGSFIQW